jgi:hypothetical protein
METLTSLIDNCFKVLFKPNCGNEIACSLYVLFGFHDANCIIIHRYRNNKEPSESQHFPAALAFIKYFIWHTQIIKDSNSFKLRVRSWQELRSKKLLPAILVHRWLRYSRCAIQYGSFIFRNAKRIWITRLMSDSYSSIWSQNQNQNQNQVCLFNTPPPESRKYPTKMACDNRPHIRY